MQHGKNLSMLFTEGQPDETVVERQKDNEFSENYILRNEIDNLQIALNVKDKEVRKL